MQSRKSLEYTGPRLKDQQLLAIELPSWLEKSRGLGQTNKNAAKSSRKQNENVKNGGSSTKPKQIMYLRT